MTRTIAIGTAWLALASSAAGQVTEATTLVSFKSSGGLPNDDVGGRGIDATGRWFVADTYATDFLPVDANGHILDVLWFDRATGEVRLVSRGPGGVQGDQASFEPRISATGRIVAFESWATNLVAGDVANTRDVFVHDVATGLTRLAGGPPAGGFSNGDSFVGTLNEDGRYLGFASFGSNLVPSDTNGGLDAFVKDLATGAVERVSVRTGGAQAFGGSRAAHLSADGNRALFTSFAPDLVAGDVNGKIDLFLRDRAAGTTVIVSVSSSGAASNGATTQDYELSADGRFAAFDSDASTLVAGDTNARPDVFLRDLTLGTTRRISIGPGGMQLSLGGSYPRISGQGERVAFLSNSPELLAPHLPGPLQVFVWEMASDTARPVSVDPAGVPGQAQASIPGGISRDGSVVLFGSRAPHLTPVSPAPIYGTYVRDLGSPEAALYGTFKPDSSGCRPRVERVATCSVSSGEPFVVRAFDLPPQRNGCLFFGSAPTSVPFHGGTLCVAPPLTRTPLSSSGPGLAGFPCSGRLAYDFGPLVRSGTHPALAVGSTAYAQFFYRDPGAPDPVGLSSALRFAVLP